MNIGILISPKTDMSHLPLRKQLPEPMFYEKLTEIGRKLNQNVYVFHASHINSEQLILGYRFENNNWQKTYVPLPNIVIDRTFHHNSLQAQKHMQFMKLLESKHHFVHFNSQLPHKLIVYSQLQSSFPQLIPPTVFYDNIFTLDEWLAKHEEGIILKPQAGMQGKGIIHIKKYDTHYVINGRQINNQPITSTISNRVALQKWLLYFKQNINYLLQPYYHLLTPQGEPFDIRVLMQKNKDGVWQYSGDIARVGAKNNLTSNLHGGGKSIATTSLLNICFGQEKVTQLLKQIHMISWKIVEQIETSFGRFGELALDFGITKSGDIVLLECNSKPGRQAFMQDAYYAEKVILQPLLYAQYLFDHYVKQRKKNYAYSHTSIIL